LQAFDANFGADDCVPKACCVRTFIQMSERLDTTTVQVGFVILVFLAFLFFGDQLGATGTKHVRTGIQVPTTVRLSPQATAVSRTLRFSDG
jgi:hypothetical protein